MRSGGIKMEISSFAETRAWAFWKRLQDSVPAVIAISAATLLLPAAHPLFIPFVGAPSHLLWWVHVLPVAMVTYRFGLRGAFTVVAASAALVLAGERAFGNGYGQPADWETALSLFVALSATNLLVAGFALYARIATADLRDFAYRDPLTQLPNRNFLEDHLHGQRRANRPQTLLFLDLSDFNAVNDSFGHFAGDQLLRLVAERLKQQLDDRDLLTRWAGDKFFILLESCHDRSEAEETARRLVASLHQPLSLKDMSLPMDACIGIARGSKPAGQLMREADTALNRAKARGPGSTEFFGRDMWQAAQRRLAMSSALKSATADRGLSNCYQPVHDSSSGRILGIETLVRWHDETFGRVSPGEFIPLAETNGAIVRIGAQVLETALADIDRWRRQELWEPDMFLSVNVSPLQLHDSDFVDTLIADLERRRIDPGALVLEITETAFMQFEASTIEALHRLREQGVRLAIDDFGSGYSSLTRLNRLPVDILKIDRELVRQIDQEEGPDLVRPVVEMARTLDLRVIAEGIETRAQFDRLAAMDVSMIQGFLLSKPTTADSLWLREAG